MEKIALAINGVSALVFAGGTAMLAMVIPSIWTLQSDMGSTKTTLANIEKKFDSLDKKLDSIESKIDIVVKRADSIEVRLTTKETDPSLLVAQSGLRPESEFGGVRVGEKLFVLPKSDKAALELAASGMMRENITPSTFGYVIGIFDEAGKLSQPRAVPISSPGAAPPESRSRR